MNKIVEKASILIEALPYIKQFAGKTFVIKYGGHAMESEELRYSFAQDIVLMKYVGINPVIVHGGGPQIAEFLKRQGVESQFISGMRVTDEATMEVVEMTLSGKINREIVSLINKAGGMAVGLSGRDAGLINVEKMYVDSVDKETGSIEKIDVGQVGKVTRVDTTILDGISNEIIPVISPIGVSADFMPYNVNADIAAGAIASALKAEKLFLLTDVDGVKDKEGNRMSTVKCSDVERLKNDGTLKGGMIPKVDCAADAVKAGVSKAHIVDGRVRHSVLLEIFTDLGVGTQVLDV